ncbi:hypothetical protein Ddc_14268 [Ditylenchus destructor]|nr:hypothetical protein Ddc_14268 [Ditylenchus destructor]
MTSPPVYSTALQQALSLLPHISSTEMKVLISAAKAQWIPRFSNEILADSFRFIRRKTLTKNICRVNSRYFQICVNSVPNVHKIHMISIGCYNKKLFLEVPYETYDEKGRHQIEAHEAELDDFPDSAPFLRFDIVSIGTHIDAYRICEFFRSHRETFSQCQLLKMEDSCFRPKYVLAESNVQMCDLLVDVFKNSKRVTISGVYDRRDRLSADDESLLSKWKENMVAYLAHYLFNKPNAFLRIDFGQETLAALLLEKIKEVFKDATLKSEFCVSFISRKDEISALHDHVFTTENNATQQQLLLFKSSCEYEYRLWCRNIKPSEDEKKGKKKTKRKNDKELSHMNGISALQIKECETLYTPLYDYWDYY